ncbi:MAG TPA: four-carbon acid sugar kinase family protein [Verrucomicrobiae bacterium]|nr:four-carbon acid sugar kinase family protein [Verrucomicrobiae bacterium]
MTARPQRIRKADLFAALPPEWPHDPRPEIQRLLAASRSKVVVLDDDPTGTQTVHNVPVLTEWSVESLHRELGSDNNCFYILTNSRSLPPDGARELNLEIARALKTASEMADRRIAPVSRSDSTLRGHFPLETDALNEILGPFDAVLLVPFFETGGRHTVNDVHYLADGEWLTPVAESQFARDVTFGYRNSDLRAWVEEKSGGRMRADEVASISVDTIRRDGPETICRELMPLNGGRVCVGNIVSGRDLLVFILGLLRAEAAGKRFLYRTAASFAAARAGIAPCPLLTARELFGDDDSAIKHQPSTINSSRGGLVVVGSYVPKSSEQLQRLLEGNRTANVEVSVRALLTDDFRAGEIVRATQSVNEALRHDRDTVLYTSRQLVTGSDPAESLSLCRRVSESLMQILDGVAVRPRFVIAKGGITSSDVATKPLRVRRAMVLGQILAGIPLWRLGEESRWPGMIYVSFPGNLGGPGALKDVVEMLAGPR